MLAILILSTVESIIEVFFAFKAKVAAKKSHGPWTFIGKHYESSTLTDNEKVYQQQRLPIIRKVIGDGDDEEAASSTRNMSVSFGPVYRGLEEETWKRAKQEAWQYVLRTSDDVGGAGQTRDTEEIYINAVRGIEVESRALYGDGTGKEDPLASLSVEDFRMIMIVDDCFLLQVALFVLGGSKQMHYPIDVETFGLPQGPQRNKELIRAVISSMFVVGNQIPILVLKELMKQSFFKKIVEQGKWQRPLDLERWVLFDLILVPMLDVKGGDIFIPTASLPRFWYVKRGFSVPPRNNYITQAEFITNMLIESGNYFISSLIIYIKKKKRNPSVIEAYDLLQGLWLLMSGLSPCNEGGDLDHQINSDDIEHNSYHVIHPIVRSATELKKAGITFMCIEGTRIKKIIFEQSVFITILKLPKIIIGSEMEFLFSNLIQYEVSREDLGENRRKICAYLQLLRELIRTHDDVKLLAASGIIIVDPNEEEELPDTLRRLDIPKVNAHRSLSKVRDQLNNYTRPSMYKRLGSLISLVALLALIQMVFSVLNYKSKKTTT